MTGRTRAGVLAALVVTLAVGVTLSRTGDALLMLVQLSPAIVLLSVLLLGGYPGERWLVVGSPGRRIACARGPASAPATGFVRPVRGGELIGRALAGRAPPARLCIT